jgi:MFS superfamily sulfate permease-like transporter
MNPATGMALARQNKVEAVIYAVTAVSIFAFGLLQGVLIGFALALMQVIYRLNHVTIEVESKDERVTVVLHGNATFLAIPKLSRAIDKIEPQQKVHVLIERLNYIDHAIIDLLDTWQKDYERSGGELSVEWHQLHNLH